MFVCVCMYVCGCVCMHACICMCVCVYVCMYVCMYVRTYVCMYVHMYVCICKCMCVRGLYLYVYNALYYNIIVCLCMYVPCMCGVHYLNNDDEHPKQIQYRQTSHQLYYSSQFIYSFIKLSFVFTKSN